MPVNGYFGLPRSGKSYSVVEGPVCQAIANGRRVVTNIEGIDSEKVRQYVHKRYGLALERLGHIVKVSSTDIVSLGDDGKPVGNPRFFPHYGRNKEIVTEDCLVQPGDLVALDEAWKLFPAGERVHPNHLSFFAEHGHFVHPETGVACDLVFITQALELVHRNLKAMCAFLFETHRKAMFGAQGAKTFSVNMWEGNKATKTAKCGNWVKRYDPDIFELYKSVAGDEVQLADIDKRQNVLRGWKAWVALASVPLLLGVSVWAGYAALKSFGGTSAKAAPGSTPVAAPGGLPAAVQPAGTPAVAPAYKVTNSDLRVAGEVVLAGQRFVALVDSSGVMRYESPDRFAGRGLFIVGTVEGARVSSFTGGPVSHGGAIALPGVSK